MNPVKKIPSEPAPAENGDRVLSPVTTEDSGISDEKNLNLERIEYETILEALRKNRYVISKAAKDLGLTRAALYRRMEKYDI
jgi:transcriptional regulator of acetoin/glycerol metabolism